MKKLLPFFVVILAFTGFLSIQLFFDSLKTTAGQTSKDKEKNSFYESVYKELKFDTTQKKNIELAKIKAPVVILNFWASWCSPCLKEFPSIIEMKKKFSDEQVMVIGINTDDENQDSAIAKTSADFKFNFPVVADKESKITNKFSITGIPLSIIFVRGKVQEVTLGSKDFNSPEMTDFINQAQKVN